MYLARQRAEWSRAACIATVVVNTHGGWKGGRPANESDFCSYLGERPDVVRLTSDNAASLGWGREE